MAIHYKSGIIVFGLSFIILSIQKADGLFINLSSTIAEATDNDPV